MLHGGDGNDVYVISSRTFDLYDSSGTDSAIVNVNFLKLPSSIENVSYANGVVALPYWIDALLPDEAAAFASFLGGSKAFNYTYPQTLSSYDTSSKDAYGYSAFNSQQRAFSLLAMDYISSVVDVHFVETNNSAAPNTITFANNAQADSSGYAYYPDDAFKGSDLFINTESGNLSPTDGQRSALVLIHELGHTLGLKHPGSYNAGGGTTEPPYLSSNEDKAVWTVMSYTENSAQFHLQYSPLDIAALQYLYGPSTTIRATNDTYAVSATASNFIWDGGGADTISASGLSTAVTLYLEPGYWGYVGSKASFITDPGQVTVNFGTVIENLTGGSGNDSLFGNTVSNVISGGSGDDTISGGSGDDTISGGAGDDRIDGSSGTDVVVYLTTYANSVLTRLPNGSVTVSSATAGLDTLTNTEYIQFADQIISLSNHIPISRHLEPDFNGDSKSDILLHGTGGEIYIWDMNDTQIIGGGLVANPSNYWSVAGTGDFNGDGKSDILLHGTGGEIYIWDMNDAQITGGGLVANPGNYWSVAGTGDFNGDNKSDIMLHGTAGEVYVYDMNDNQIIGGGLVGNPGNYWSVADTKSNAVTQRRERDFGGDGKSDILLHGASGEIYVWDMNDTQITGGGLVAYLGNYWSVAGTGDFNGDAKSDILLHGASGEVYVYDMNDTQITGGGLVAYPGNYWSVASTGDFNGDAKSDILLHGASGEVYVWDMSDTQITGGGLVGNPTNYWMITV